MSNIIALYNLIKQAGDVPFGDFPVKLEAPKKKRKKYPYQGFIDFQGLKIDVENKQGSTRRGENKEGKPWSVLMQHHYGEIRGTEGVDGDKLDAYVGPNADSPLVVVVHQQNPDTKAYDEDKVMLGFDSVGEAVKAYKDQYNKPGFYRNHTVLNIGQFWRWVHDKNVQGKKVQELKKEAAVPWEEIKALLKGEMPLFHMVNKENVEGFLKSKGVVMSPFEAQARGVLKSVEGSVGTQRFPVTGTSTLPYKLSPKAVRIKGEHLADRARVTAPVESLSRASGRSPAAEYDRSGLYSFVANTEKVPSKNWSSISLSPESPIPHYGDVGLLTSPSNIRGTVHTTPWGEQAFASPVAATRSGVLHHVTLPRAEGVMVYNPKTTSKELAERLEAQGATPLTDELLANLRKLSKKSTPLPKSPEQRRYDWGDPDFLLDMEKKKEQAVRKLRNKGYTMARHPMGREKLTTLISAPNKIKYLQKNIGMDEQTIKWWAKTPRGKQFLGDQAKTLV